MASKSVRELSNIGPKTATWLEAVGVKTLEDIESLGVIEVYERLKVLYSEKVSLNALWALQGAILDVPWNEIPESMKENLKQRLQRKGDNMELLTLEQFYTHWQGHRRLTIRTLEMFPEDKLFSYKVEPMRTFGEIANEFIMVEKFTLNGIITGDWSWQPSESITSKAALLTVFAEMERKTKELWPKLTLERIEAVEKDAWGLEGPNRNRLLYMCDNEIHHRAQGYVYLRSLGIEPPAFWER